MSSGIAPRFRRKLHLTGLVAVILALVSQLALGSVRLPEERPDTGLAALEAAMVLCQSGRPDAGTDRAPLPHHAHDCALCPHATALALPAVVPAPDAVLPGPGDALPLRPASPAHARAPPSHSFAAAYPRGPPVLA